MISERVRHLWLVRNTDRPIRSWRNAETMLCLLEAGGSPPPGSDAEPPDHKISLAEIILTGRDLVPPARRAEERDFDIALDEFDEDCRVHAAKKAAHRSAWIDFKRRNDLDIPPAA